MARDESGRQADADFAYRLANLTFGYDDQPVLAGVGLDVGYGDFVGLIGPNGSGKSTLLKLMLGQLPPQSGTVWLQGRPVAETPAEHRARTVGYLPQQVAASFRFTAGQVVMMGRHPHLRALRLESEADAAAAEACMRALNVEELRDRHFETLSGGERQRVLLASVLAQEPQIILLDEPTAALDLHHQVEVMRALTALNRQGVALVMVTHDLNLAARYCPRLCLLHDRRIRADGPPAAVLTGGILRAAYGDALRVIADPDTGAPVVLPAVEAEEQACA